MADTTEFLPFHAINEFMRPDFRLSVIRETLTSQAQLDHPCVNELNHQIKKHVTVPGFRNSDKAPALVKVLPTSKAFEKYPDLVGSVLSCWSESQSELREKVYVLLKIRNWPVFSSNEGDFDIAALKLDLIKVWPIFPLSINRVKLPGFYTHCYIGEDFEAIYTNFTEQFPGYSVSIDKVSLMAVWLTMRLPYHVDIELKKDQAEESPDQSAQMSNL